MFTGIITDIGRIESVDQTGDLRVRIATRYETTGIDLGASIACSGVCLTVVDKGPGWFAVDVSGETVSRSAKGMWHAGRRLNLERALKLGDELGGHIVTGHVDGVGEIVELREEGGSMRVTIAAGAEVAPYIAAKGSITVDGISLTVNSVEDVESGVRFGLNIIPHTAEVTTFASLEVGQAVNLEIDVLARYLKRMQQLSITS
ncbi:riboflavin synthase [Stakelama pacifica]|uniref:Riboflavin synthase n=1 Tax=Stakelama pacifica TaxID=517720 RepID=A0A4R6FMV1_9SPHN|nr:riboflavin synthase [Stakelama pacifica]MAW99305.1 riboflavin synthase [Sphingomonas sp.]TDN82921.1 riboflavin synthase alpha chain [Stakelama pacifica]GGO95194.1 riboflavin synthase subunit alpha [Stakelama pacifica]